MAKKNQFRLTVEYPGTAYDEGMDKTVDNIVGQSLEETGSGMDLLRMVRDKSYVGTRNMMVCVVDKLMRQKGLLAITIYPTGE